MKVTRVALTVALGLALGAGPLVARAQAPRVARVGILAGGGSGFHGGFEPFRQRLRELGYVEDQTIALVVRNAEGRAARYPELAAELVRLQPHVIVVQGNAALVALKQATRTIAVVMANIGDPVGAGFVASLARPGGNITGLSNMAEGVSAKWVELLKEVAPKATRLAVLRDPRNVAHASMWKEIQAAGQALRVTPLAWEARGPDEIERAFAAMGAERIDSVIVLPHPAAGANLRQIVGLATRHRLPATYLTREFADVGGLMSYGPNVADLWRGAAGFVDRILKGARPADLPVEQPTTFELVINLKTARALGLTIPPSLSVRADEIIR
ncbi:MAG: ABC transporter substrate-binding protein [Candidatus Rokubacteria bacterium]|nr:ABC transporter substrate-binding protein [Candidatus Rokubacteria bacterium]